MAVCTHLDRWIPKQVWKIPSLKLTAKAPWKMMVERLSSFLFGKPYFQRLPRSFRGCIFVISSLRGSQVGGVDGCQETPLENFTHFAIFTRSSVVSWPNGLQVGAGPGRRHGECSWVGSNPGTKTKRTSNEIGVIDNLSSHLVVFSVFFVHEIRVRTHHVLNFNDPISIVPTIIMLLP